VDQANEEKDMNVKLKPYEVTSGAMVGLMREAKSREEGRVRTGGDPDEPSMGWGIHIEGALGEMAVAKALGLYWSASVNTFKTEADVGIYEVRTRSRDWYDLLIRSDDSDDKIFILVTGSSPDFCLRGWFRAGDAKQDKWLQHHGGKPPAWFVPQKYLLPISELPKEKLPVSLDKSSVPNFDDDAWVL
jgi:hypothetical protein